MILVVRLNANRIFYHDIDDAVARLSTGGGFDQIHSNHFKHASLSCKRFLSKLFSSFLDHGYVPRDILLEN